MLNQNFQQELDLVLNNQGNVNSRFLGYQAVLKSKIPDCRKEERDRLAMQLAILREEHDEVFIKAVIALHLGTAIVLPVTEDTEIPAGHIEEQG